MVWAGRLVYWDWEGQNVHFYQSSRLALHLLLLPLPCNYLLPPPFTDLHVIIFDEIDAICKSRGSVRDGSGVHDTVVNQLLTKIDGVDALNNILLIGMTNRCGEGGGEGWGGTAAGLAGVAAVVLPCGGTGAGLVD